MANDWIGPEGMLADTSFASSKAVALKILNEKAGIKYIPHNDSSN